MNQLQLILYLAALAALSGPVARAETLSLAGQWRFQLDRTVAGINERWFTSKLNAAIELPGCLGDGALDHPDLSSGEPCPDGDPSMNWRGCMAPDAITS